MNGKQHEFALPPYLLGVKHSVGATATRVVLITLKGHRHANLQSQNLRRRVSTR